MLQGWLRLFIPGPFGLRYPTMWPLAVKAGLCSPPGTDRGWTQEPSWPLFGPPQGQVAPHSRRSCPAPEAAVPPPSSPSHRCGRRALRPPRPAVPCAYDGRACSGTSCRACGGASQAGETQRMCGKRSACPAPPSAGAVLVTQGSRALRLSPRRFWAFHNHEKHGKRAGACRSNVERCTRTGHARHSGAPSAAHQPSLRSLLQHSLTLRQSINICGRSCSAAPHRLDSLQRRRSSVCPLEGVVEDYRCSGA